MVVTMLEAVDWDMYKLADSNLDQAWICYSKYYPASYDVNQRYIQSFECAN